MAVICFASGAGISLIITVTDGHACGVAWSLDSALRFWGLAVLSPFSVLGGSALVLVAMFRSSADAIKINTDNSFEGSMKRQRME